MFEESGAHAAAAPSPRWQSESSARGLLPGLSGGPEPRLGFSGCLGPSSHQLPHLPSPCPFLQGGRQQRVARKRVRGALAKRPRGAGGGGLPGERRRTHPEAQRVGGCERPSQPPDGFQVPLVQNYHYAKMHFWCGIFCHHSKPTSPCPDHASLLVGLPAVVLATLAASDFLFFWGWVSGGRRGQLKPFLCSKPSGSLRFNALQWSTRPS